MAFDEDGQADNLERRKQICRRAYDILTEQVGFPAEDIIFDPNVFAVATGIEEHANYGARLHRGHPLDQAEPARRAGLRRRLERLVLLPRQQPGARGHPRGVPVPRHRGRHGHGHRQRRRARGLRRGARRCCASGSRTSSSTAAPTAPSGCWRSPGTSPATARSSEVATEEWRSLPVGERITHALVKGIDAFAESDTEELRAGDRRPRRPADRGHRGPADGRHERRRRPVRRRARCSCRRW